VVPENSSSLANKDLRSLHHSVNSSDPSLRANSQQPEHLLVFSLHQDLVPVGKLWVAEVQAFALQIAPSLPFLPPALANPPSECGSCSGTDKLCSYAFPKARIRFLAGRLKGLE